MRRSKEIGHGAGGVRGDVAKMDDLDKLFLAVGQQAGQVDILFANAGVADHAKIEQVTKSQFDNASSTNVKGVFFVCKKLFRVCRMVPPSS